MLLREDLFIGEFGLTLLVGFLLNDHGHGEFLDGVDVSESESDLVNHDEARVGGERELVLEIERHEALGEGGLRHWVEVVDLSVGGGKHDLALDALQLPVDEGHQVFEQLFVRRKRLQPVLHVRQLARVHLLVLKVQERARKQHHVRSFSRHALQEQLQRVVVERLVCGEGTSCVDNLYGLSLHLHLRTFLEH